MDEDFLRLSSSENESLEYYLAHIASMAPPTQFGSFERFGGVTAGLTFLLLQPLRSLFFNKVIKMNRFTLSFKTTASSLGLCILVSFLGAQAQAQAPDTGSPQVATATLATTSAPVSTLAVTPVGTTQHSTQIAPALQGRYLVGTQPTPVVFPFLTADNKKIADESWAVYQKDHGHPITEWAQSEIRFSGTGTVFYPFSGPDFVTVNQVYPDADRYVMVAMQSAGEPALLAPMSPERAQQFQAKFLREWKRFAYNAFFITAELEADRFAKSTHIGITTILMTFALYSGYDIAEVYPITYDSASGQFIKSAGPWKSVRLVLKKNGKTVALDYVSLDLSDQNLLVKEPMRGWLSHMTQHPMLIKAASHLLQDGNFIVIRDMIVKNAPMVVQDETGVDFAQLKKIGNVNLYGGFLLPFEQFSPHKQQSLAQAYRLATDVKPMPFAFSYNKEHERRSVQIVRREPRQSD